MRVSISVVYAVIVYYTALVEHPACKILSQYRSEQSLVVGLPQLARLLHAEKLIKQMPTEGEEQMLLEEVQKAVCIDCQMLLTFAECLLQSPSTATIGSIIKAEYSKYLYNVICQP